jgi:hypothetical protein
MVWTEKANLVGRGIRVADSPPVNLPCMMYVIRLARLYGAALCFGFFFFFFFSPVFFFFFLFFFSCLVFVEEDFTDQICFH